MDKAFLVMLLLLSCVNPKQEAKAQEESKPVIEQKNLQGANILMVIAPKDFRDEELFTPKELFLTAGANVAVASTTLDTCIGMLGGKVRPDVDLAVANMADFDALVFVGGAGATVLWDNPQAHALAQTAKGANKLIGAICLAPVILAKAGLLNGVEATCFKSAQADLVAGGAIFKPDAVVTHQGIVTADGPLAAKPFAEKMIALLREVVINKASAAPADTTTPIDSTTPAAPDTATPSVPEGQ
jgi:protease I